MIRNLVNGRPRPQRPIVRPRPNTDHSQRPRHPSLNLISPPQVNFGTYSTPFRTFNTTSRPKFINNDTFTVKTILHNPTKQKMIQKKQHQTIPLQVIKLQGATFIKAKQHIGLDLSCNKLQQFILTPRQMKDHLYLIKDLTPNQTLQNLHRNTQVKFRKTLGFNTFWKEKMSESHFRKCQNDDLFEKLTRAGYDMTKIEGDKQFQQLCDQKCLTSQEIFYTAYDLLFEANATQQPYFREFLTEIYDHPENNHLPRTWKVLRHWIQRNHLTETPHELDEKTILHLTNDPDPESRLTNPNNTLKSYNIHDKLRTIYSTTTEANTEFQKFRKMIINDLITGKLGNLLKEPRNLREWPVNWIKILRIFDFQGFLNDLPSLFPLNKLTVTRTIHQNFMKRVIPYYTNCNNSLIIDLANFMILGWNFEIILRRQTTWLTCILTPGFFTIK
ncbi:MAG: hypothetical protein ACPGII_10315, partial [Opitutales bacterium]